MIKFENVTMDSFGHASFEVKPGSSCKIIVNSRHDKKILLGTMLGLLKPAGGIVRLFGRDIYSISEQESFAILSKVGVAWQDGRLISNLKVWENVILPACYHQGKRPEDLEGKVVALLGDLKIGGGNLSGFMGESPGHLSVHEKRLAGLIRAMLPEPELVIYDSLFEDLAPEETDFLTKLTQDFQSERPGRVSVYVSSDEQSLQHIETDMALKQAKRELR